MAKYLLIESRDPFETEDVRHFYDLATSLARAANRVTLVLTQDGVRAARAGHHTFWFVALAQVGVEVLADRRSLRERGLTADRLPPGVRPTEIDAVGGHLAEGRTTLRH
jgi:intracellular sulfur oxidation DsrE/DsrF family protein